MNNLKWQTVQDAKKYLTDEKIAIIGYGIQGSAQACNLRDNGFDVIVGQRKHSSSYQKALDDGWIEGETLFEIEPACERASMIAFLISDDAQIDLWPSINKHLSENKSLLFSHGFSITYRHLTKLIPPQNIDVMLLAPKGTGSHLREAYLAMEPVNCSFAIFQNYTGHAKKKILAYGRGVCHGLLFPTTFDKETFSDLTGERGALLAAFFALLVAQYEVLREHGHSSNEAYNETQEELFESLLPIIKSQGFEAIFNRCSKTARVGVLKWAPIFKERIKPIFEELYQSVCSGKEADEVLNFTDMKQLDEKIHQLSEHELCKMAQHFKKKF